MTTVWPDEIIKMNNEEDYNLNSIAYHVGETTKSGHLDKFVFKVTISFIKLELRPPSPSHLTRIVVVYATLSLHSPSIVLIGHQEVCTIGIYGNKR